ncbi:hypothetical protein HDU84_004112 [Entophlyctis sp. JEL0112]|nr:hypothetical protein HDU84_004112 [Entophlyctis sp. JEL0112]
MDAKLIYSTRGDVIHCLLDAVPTSFVPRPGDFRLCQVAKITVGIIRKLLTAEQQDSPIDAIYSSAFGRIFNELSRKPVLFEVIPVIVMA